MTTKFKEQCKEIFSMTPEANARIRSAFGAQSVYHFRENASYEDDLDIFLRYSENEGLWVGPSVVIDALLSDVELVRRCPLDCDDGVLFDLERERGRRLTRSEAQAIGVTNGAYILSDDDCHW